MTCVFGSRPDRREAVEGQGKGAELPRQRHPAVLDVNDGAPGREARPHGERIGARRVEEGHTELGTRPAHACERRGGKLGGLSALLLRCHVEGLAHEVVWRALALPSQAEGHVATA
eukprot:CAMPEP_0173414116 /NCGR_PEP_ID=MMETSP1356-20130122/83668_1 /TAXON_ID=77927 ORGANISM="Hemiselmis virescens, Strain PCC157" /NCGR_SAMPLE_ID=MMETSP1356 /ASSEMBLY_ACC=CAM_ASM_000847 /LENGTH=115 /DNA_ID=CAMNT_0014376237 /DNA_START=554 /DNA_END=902 /DNA_ORIENTATION=+